MCVFQRDETCFLSLAHTFFFLSNNPTSTLCRKFNFNLKNIELIRKIAFSKIIKILIVRLIGEHSLALFSLYLFCVTFFVFRKTSIHLVLYHITLMNTAEHFIHEKSVWVSIILSDWLIDRLINNPIDLTCKFSTLKKNKSPHVKSRCFLYIVKLLIRHIS